MKALLLQVSGVVQGVGFRPFVYQVAEKTNLKGYVKNLGDAGVRIHVEGKSPQIQRFIRLLKENNPRNARIDSLEKKEIKPAGYEKFEIKKSGGQGVSGTLPSDTCLCEACLKELFDPDDRRYRFPFISCTDCGPRFTSIKGLPFDRENTSFSDFKLCAGCEKEYHDPKNRRFHAQTISCSDCGPSFYLTDSQGEKIQTRDVFKETAELLKEKAILTIKGVGGMHIACRIASEKLITRLREKLHRPEQPFAIMCRDLKQVRSIARLSEKEKDLLLSPERPIVLLEKKENFSSPGIAPDLDSIGIMLPYAGVHHLILNELDEPLIMTSANPSGEPMVIDNEKALDLDFSDYYLLHDLEIVNRCDDSVMKLVNETPTFLRRSRGFVPQPLTISEFNPNGENILAVGPEINSTAALVAGEKAFLSQYIGNTSKPETLSFLKQAIDHLLRISKTHGKLNAIACDLHPGFASRRLAEKISEERNIPLFEIQHHVAHLHSLRAEYDLKKLVCIAVDGAGYGLDETVWGGEVLSYDGEKTERSGFLKKQPMPSGDRCAYYPARMLLSILHEKGFSPDELSKILDEENLYLEYGKEELSVMVKQIEKEVNLTHTSSTGRVLDAVSSLLGICDYRSYEGEPAIKLEAVANRGSSLDMDFPIEDGVLDTSLIVTRALELKQEGHNPEDIAYSVIEALASGLSEIARDTAFSRGINKIGVSGGVAYNNLFVRLLSGNFIKDDLMFYQHCKLPPGDGCISLGQAIGTLEYEK